MNPTHPRLAEAARWSVLVRDVATGEVVLEHAPEAMLSVASVAKLPLLFACAALIERGELDPAEPLDRSSVPPVGDSGLWQHLAQPTLAAADAAALVGAVSDNLATNVLLARVGLDAVERECGALGLGGLVLHDAVRDERGPEHAPRLGSGSAAGAVALLERLASGALGGVGDMVLEWMRHSVDLSMVASAFGQDPLSHGMPGAAIALWSKTGTDADVRADVGLVRAPNRALAYAAIANWAPAPGVQDAVLASMRAIGSLVRVAIERR